MHNKQRSQGFTLIELLVAISILAIVAVLGWRGLDSLIRTRTALNKNLEQTRSMQLTFAQLQSDCIQLATAAMIGARAALYITQNHLMLIRTVADEQQPLHVQVISYRLSNDVLSRRESTTTRDLAELDALWQSALQNTDTSPPITLQSDIAAMSLRLWSKNNASWSPPNTNITSMDKSNLSVPSGLEVALQLRDRKTVVSKLFFLGAT